MYRCEIPCYTMVRTIFNAQRIVISPNIIISKTSLFRYIDYSMYLIFNKDRIHWLFNILTKWSFAYNSDQKEYVEVLFFKDVEILIDYPLKILSTKKNPPIKDVSYRTVRVRLTTFSASQLHTKYITFIDRWITILDILKYK